MPVYRKTTGGVFATVNALNVNVSGEFKSVTAAWINVDGEFKKIFPNITYEDPSAYYDIDSASTPVLTQNTDSESYQAWQLNALQIPLLSNLEESGVDVTWSSYEYITMDTEEVVPVDMYSTGAGSQPRATHIEYNGSSVDITKYSDGTVFNSTNTNIAIIDRLSYLGWFSSSGYCWFKVNQTDLSSYYNRQLGMRLRWYSSINSKYFEYIFTDSGFMLTATS